MNGEYNGKERTQEEESLEVETGNVSVMKVENHVTSEYKKP